MAEVIPFPNARNEDRPPLIDPVNADEFTADELARYVAIKGEIFVLECEMQQIRDAVKRRAQEGGQ